MYLLDTNIFLELLLEQEKADTVRVFLKSVSTSQLAISDFTLHSIGIVLVRLNKLPVLNSFLDDILVQGNIWMYSIPPEQLSEVLQFVTDYGLDFDDAYQYTISVQYDLQIVSFDHDFDKTPKGRKTPSDL